MKKLLVLALVVVMTLSLAAVSMAAVTMSGEVNFGFNLATPQSDFGNAKIAATAALNDEVTAFAALKANTGGWSMTAGPIVPGVTAESGLVLVDEAWVKFTEGFGTVKVGYFGWNIKDNCDILSYVGADVKTNATIAVDATVAEGVTFGAAIARKTDKMDTGIKVGYKADAFGVSVGYKKFDADTDSTLALNGFYNLTPAVLYLTYSSMGTVKNAVIGASYDSDSIYARAEYQVTGPDGFKADSGFRLGYKLGNGAKLEYNLSADGDLATNVSSLKLNVAF